MSNRPALALPTALAMATLIALGACQPDIPEPVDLGPQKEAIDHRGERGEDVTGLFSPIVRSGHLYFLSGVIGRSQDGDIGAATRQAMDGIRTRLEAVDLTMDDLVKCTVFLVDMADYNGMNAAYREYFPTNPPARSALAVRELPASAQVEVECIGAAR